MFQKPSPVVALSHNDELKQKLQTPDDVETVVGPSVHVEGDFASEGNIVVKGSVSGSVKTSRLLSVEENAKILAHVQAGDAVVAGEVRGNIKVKNRLELTATARINGDISCALLVVEAGCLLLGKVSMKGIEPEKSDKKRGLGKVKIKDEQSHTDFPQETV